MTTDGRWLMAEDEGGESRKIDNYQLSIINCQLFRGMYRVWFCLWSRVFILSSEENVR